MKEGASAGEEDPKSLHLSSAEGGRERRNIGHPRLKSRPGLGRNRRLMIPRESPSRPIPVLNDPLRPGVQVASFGSMRHWEFHR